MTLLVYTYSCRSIAYQLLDSMPSCHFYIAAPVVVARANHASAPVSNVASVPDIVGIPALLESLEARSQLLLDINAGDEVGDIVLFKSSSSSLCL